MKLFVCKTSDVSPASCREFFVGKRTVLICEFNGAFYAHSSICPHQGNHLDGALLWGNAIDCPWHHYLFDVKTGENLYPRGCPPLKTFQTSVNGESIFITLPSSRRGASKIDALE